MIAIRRGLPGREVILSRFEWNLREIQSQMDVGSVLFTKMFNASTGAHLRYLGRQMRSISCIQFCNWFWGSFCDLECYGDLPLAFNRLPTEQGGAIPPLSNSLKRRWNQHLRSAQWPNPFDAAVFASNNIDFNYAFHFLSERRSGISGFYLVDQRSWLQAIRQSGSRLRRWRSNG